MACIASAGLIKDGTALLDERLDGVLPRILNTSFPLNIIVLDKATGSLWS